MFVGVINLHVLDFGLNYFVWFDVRGALKLLKTYLLSHSTSGVRLH